MNTIKFSHNYPKLHWQTTARLLAVEVYNRKNMHPDFVEYDTRYTYNGAINYYYPLPPGKYLVLVFLGSMLIPFTTIRSARPGKENYYRSKIGERFAIEAQP